MSRRGRSKENAEQEPQAKAAPGGLEGTGADEAQIPENYEYAAYDPLHGKIVVRLKEAVNDLYNQSVENPDSDANEIVRILLLNQMANMNPETYHREPRLTYTEERHRGVEVDDKKEMNQQKAKQFDMAQSKHLAEMRRLNVQIQNLEMEGRQREMKLEQAQRMVDQARAAEEHGQPMDHLAIYNKIAEVIGLRPPSAEQ
jgi:hypothetical protein